MQQIEAVVAKVNDLQDGEKRQVTVGENDVLLIRVNGNFQAVGAYCTHYQAPLVEGVLSGDRSFIIFYIKDNQVLAAASSQRDTETAAITELMRLNQMPDPEVLRQGKFDLVKLLQS